MKCSVVGQSRIRENCDLEKVKLNYEFEIEKDDLWKRQSSIFDDAWLAENGHLAICSQTEE